MTFNFYYFLTVNRILSGSPELGKSRFFRLGHLPDLVYPHDQPDFMNKYRRLSGRR